MYHSGTAAHPLDPFGAGTITEKGIPEQKLGEGSLGGQLGGKRPELRVQRVQIVPGGEKREGSGGSTIGKTK